MNADECKIDDAYMLVGNKFLPLHRKHNRISGGYSHKDKKFLSRDEFLINLKHHLNHSLSGVPNFSRVSLLAMNKYNLKNTAVFL